VGLLSGRAGLRIFLGFPAGFDGGADIVAEFQQKRLPSSLEKIFIVTDANSSFLPYSEMFR